MYVIGHLYYLELTDKLPLHADARDEITVCRENALPYFPMIFTAIFLRGIKKFIVW